MIHQIKIFNLVDEPQSPTNRAFTIIKFSAWTCEYEKTFGLPSEICEELTLAKLFILNNRYAEFKKKHIPVHFDIVNTQKHSMFNLSTFFRYMAKKHIG